VNQTGSQTVWLYTEADRVPLRQADSFLDCLWRGVQSAVRTAAYGVDLADYPGWPDQRQDGQVVIRHATPHAGPPRPTIEEWRGRDPGCAGAWAAGEIASVDCYAGLRTSRYADLRTSEPQLS
jgi:hypothetical protein